MKNGVPARISPELRDLLIDIQAERLNSKIDKSKRNLTRISGLAFRILSQKKNMDRLLSQRC